MKCANCGNNDAKTLQDEGDTIRCALCYHRTLKTTGEDDSVLCPYCHFMRDRKAAYCRYCNTAWGTELPSKKELEETHKAVQKMLDQAKAEGIILKV